MQLDTLYHTFFKSSISSCCSIREYGLHKNSHAATSRILTSHDAESKPLQKRGGEGIHLAPYSMITYVRQTADNTEERAKIKT